MHDRVDTDRSSARRVWSPQVVRAQPGDLPAWLDLAREVEPLFGPMVDNPSFVARLGTILERGDGACVRDANGPVGSPLSGAIWSGSSAPHYRIHWLAVAGRWRRHGIGLLLMRYVLAGIVPPADVSVVTFGADHPGSQAARGLYQHLGFVPAEPVANGPEGGSRQMFRLRLNRP